MTLATCPRFTAAVHGLARRRARKWRVDADDLSQEALVAVWLADPDEPSHANVIAQNAMVDYVRWLYGRTGEYGRRPRTVKRWLSLDKKVSGGDGEPGCRLGDLIPDESVDVAGEVTSSVSVEGAIEELSPRDAALVRERLTGRLLAHLGEEHGITESRACQVMSDFRARVNDL